MGATLAWQNCWCNYKSVNPCECSDKQHIDSVSESVEWDVKSYSLTRTFHQFVGRTGVHWVFSAGGMHAMASCAVTRVDYTACADFPNVVVAGRCYAHAVSDAMFHRPAWLCLHFASCIVAQQNATFWGVAHPGGGYDPQIRARPRS